MLVYNKNGITIDSIFIGKKNKTRADKYTIYIQFVIKSKKISMGLYEMSTGINTMISAWDNGTVKGKNDTAKLINERLNSYQMTCVDMCNQFKNLSSAKDILDELKTNARIMIIGKIARGQKEQIMEKQKQYEILNVLENYLANNPMCHERKIKYNVPFQHLQNYFNGSLPLINQITEKDFEGFKMYLRKLNLKLNTVISYSNMIIAVFNYAHRIKLISDNPIPQKFSGSFEAGKRDVITQDELIQIENIKDERLKRHLLIAKYLILFQSVTGLGIKELKSIRYSHIKFQSTNAGKSFEFIEKERTKTGIQYRSILSSNAKAIKDKLIELIGNDEQPFNCVSDSLLNRQYRMIGTIAGVIKNMAPYQFRHAFACNYMECGGHPEDLMKILGHKDINTTMIYAQITAQRQADQMQEMEKKNKLFQLKNKLKIA